jgi:hypothetical protein
VEAGTSDRAATHDDELRPWYRRKFTPRQRLLFGIPFLLGFLCTGVAYLAGWITLAVVGFGLMFVSLFVSWGVVIGFYREDRAERKRRRQRAE